MRQSDAEAAGIRGAAIDINALAIGPPMEENLLHASEFIFSDGRSLTARYPCNSAHFNLISSVPLRCRGRKLSKLFIPKRPPESKAMAWIRETGNRSRQSFYLPSKRACVPD